MMSPYENLSLRIPERESRLEIRCSTWLPVETLRSPSLAYKVEPTIVVTFSAKWRSTGQLGSSPGRGRSSSSSISPCTRVARAMNSGRRPFGRTRRWHRRAFTQRPRLHADLWEHLLRATTISLDREVVWPWDPMSGPTGTGSSIFRGRSLPDDWHEALSLIRGRPFEGLRSPDWVVLEGIVATVEAVIVDLACRFAYHCLEQFDARGAEWAARQGLRVSPYDERLYRVLLKASDAAGNPAGVESIMAELVHLVADDVEPFDAVHPETLALYRRLSRRSLPSWNH